MKSVMIVLGCRPLRNSKPSPTLLNRVRKAVQEYRQGSYSEVILSGGGRGIPSSEIMRVMILSHIPENKIVLETKSKNIRQQAVLSYNFIKDKGIKNITVVTSDFEMPLARFVFRRLYSHTGARIVYASALDGVDMIQGTYERLKSYLSIAYIRIVGF